MNILKIPNPILTTRCDEVTDFSQMSSFTRDMIQTAESAGLVGLAANQCSILQRVFIVDFQSADRSQMGEFFYDWRVFVNPKIKYNVNKGKEWEYEGCASVPNLVGLIERCKEITITAQDIQGEIFSLTLNGFLARICQHEFSHIQGILITSPKQARELKRI